jgi:DNA-binding response OmpR family regulator
VQLQPPRILIVEDHQPTRAFLADNLDADGFEPFEAQNAGEARHQMAHGNPDLALVDLGLPDRDGLALVRDVRAGGDSECRIDPSLPIIVVSARGTELDRVRGFDHGADDYLVKPFSYAELRGRIGAVLARAPRRPGSRRLRVGPLEIDPLRRSVEIDGTPVKLSKKEFALLRALAEEPSRVFTREELLRGVWGYRSMGATRTLDSHASRLRRKLAAAGGGFIVNVWGVGYRLIDGSVDP